MNLIAISQFAAVVLITIFAPVTHADSNEIDEIIVSADFRERPAQSIAGSVSILDARLIAEAAVQHFEELIALVPNLNWSGDGHRARYFQIRGVGELEQYQGAPNPSIGFLIDDIDFSGIGTVATLFDIQSIEVLRGSKGSRYGANALGGLIYLRSTAPSIERDGRLQLTVGNDDAVSIGTAFGGALNNAQTSSFRFSAQKHQSNGFRDNTFLNREDTNGRDESLVRARLHFQPVDAVDANVSLMFSDIDNGYDAFSLDNGYTVLSDKPGRDAQRSLGASMRLDWTLPGERTLTALSAAANSDIDFSFDADWGNDESWSPFTYDFVTLSERERRTLSQEFRLAGDNWLIGFYGLNMTDELVTLNLGDYVDPDPVFGFAFSLADPALLSSYEATNISLFGQMEHNFTPTTRLSIGLRAEHRDTDYSDSSGLKIGPSENLWGGELSLSHDHSDKIMSFASVSKGYKAGGFNLGLVPENRREFHDEALWTIEAGIKSSLLASDLHINAAVFYSRREDQQIRTSFQLVQGDPASFGFASINLEKGTTAGIEADIRWLPNDEWELYANIGILDATIDEVGADFLSLANLNDREQAHAPQYTLASGVVYKHSRGFFGRLDVMAKDEFYFDVSHDQKSTNYAIANARLGFEGESWLASLWVTNLTNKKYAVRGFYFGNEPPNFPATLYTRQGDARQVGITVEKRF